MTVPFPTLLLAILAAAALYGGSARAGGSNSATDAQPRNEWMEAHQKFVDRAAQGKVDIVFLGDSITDRWRSAGKEVWAERYASKNAVNFGIGGDRTENVLWRIRNGELAGIAPRIVVLLIGTNNTARNTAPEIAEGISAIVGEIRSRLPNTKILLLGVFPRDEKPGTENRRKIAEVNQAIQKLDDGFHVFFLDFGNRFLQPDGSISAETMKDFLHIERAQYRVWADAMQPKLDELLH